MTGTTTADRVSPQARSRHAAPRRGRWFGSVRAGLRTVAGLVVAVVAASFLVAGAEPVEAVANRVDIPADGVVRLLGHGFGHGRGLSQYGAYGAATQGVSAGQILDFYYAGTASVAAAPGGIKVKITNGTGEVKVLADPGLVVHDLSSSWSAAVPAGSVAARIVRSGASPGKFEAHYQTSDGGWHYLPINGYTALGGPLQFSGPEFVRVVRPSDVRGFRGAVIAYPDGSGLATVNALSMQDYLRGVVPREMPASWPAAALQAQTVAARSYAVAKANRAGTYWDICDTTACQVYAGARTWVNGSLTLAEDSRADAAIAATNGLVRQAGGQTILAEFSSSNGGWTVDGGVSYMIARADPWDGITGSSVHSWGDTITRAQLQAAFPAIGTPTSLEVTARDGRGDFGGRVRTVVLRGHDGAGRATVLTVTGDQIRSAGKLRSNWFTFDVPESAIDARFVSDSAARASLGDRVGTEQYGNGYAWQEYVNGRLYWSPWTGVRLVRGGIMAAYLAAGGPAMLGVPSTDEGRAGQWGAFNHFSNGASIYWTAETGAQVVRGGIRQRFLAAGAEWVLGFPTAGEVYLPGGVVKQVFTNGEIYWSAATGAYELRGGIAAAWTAAGGQAALGLPTSGERYVAGGSVQEFSGGFTVAWTPSGTHIVAGGIRVAWQAAGGATGVLGMPTSGELSTPQTGGRYTRFTGGTVVWTAASGPVVLAGAVGQKWASLGGLDSGLPLPTGPEQPVAGGRGRVVHFGGDASVYATPAGAWLVRGGIGARWREWGGVTSLGLPRSDEVWLGRFGGWYQVFENGKILWSPTTGAQPVYGAIGRTYESLGSEWSALGLPTSGEYGIAGGVRQNYQHGTITYLYATGATTVAVS